MKRFVYRCFVLLFTVSLLAGCGKEDPANKDAAANATTTSTVVVTTTAAPSTAASSQATTTTDTATSTRRTVTTRSRTTETTTSTTASQPVNPYGITYPVTPTMSAEQSSQRIHNNVTPTKKINSTYARVTQFDPEWAFTHHPSGFVYFKGKFYASFSRGYWGEDMPGQQAVICTSKNFYDWSEPQVIMGATQGEYGETCVFPGPMYTVGNKLFVTYGISDYSKEYFDENGVFDPYTKNGTRKDVSYRIYTEDGVNWSEPERVSSIGMIYYLRQNLTGRWMSAYGSWLQYSDAPDGFKWNYYVMPTEMRNNSQKRNGGTLHESSWYQSMDGVIHLMIRSDTGYLWNAESYDNGENFTEFYPTNFSSKNSQFNFYSLPDGRPIAVGSPANPDTSVWDLWPLNIYISDDGYNFDKAYILRDEHYTKKQDGHSKGGEYAYMKFLIHDGYFYVFYSKMKEVMEVTRVKLSDLV